MCVRARSDALCGECGEGLTCRGWKISSRCVMRWKWSTCAGGVGKARRGEGQGAVRNASSAGVHIWAPQARRRGGAGRGGGLLESVVRSSAEESRISRSEQHGFQ